MQPIKLYTWSTPNGFKVHTLCEELKNDYPDFKYEVVPVDIGKNTQKEDWFLKINPNGRIPAIVDPNQGDFAVFETAAILLWLEKYYDKDHKYSWPSTDTNADKYRSEVLQWIFFVHGGVGPMQGQLNHFRMQAVGDSKNVVPYAYTRYLNETKRLYDVLELRLKDRDWLVGEGRGKYSIADMNAFGWVAIHGFSGIPRSELPPGVKRWVDNNWARPAVKKAVQLPQQSGFMKNIMEDPEWVADRPQL
ncbi:glutathione S-transferase [Acaromyces ingoldii]|uniref:Glutathione S-transferase n=1 Tax=Acaromyces ingoldii TaxID=215250 RepID=A0A316YHS2_9BASI|nr:glutathione S-transferase [Acaromyces ingoldii]PWN89100.1 glutathione S-transferase [Acaromyces ingoldii]